MEVRRWHIVDIHHDKKEQSEAEKLGMKYVKQGYELNSNDQGGGEFDYCDQYIKLIKPRRLKTKIDKAECDHVFIDNATVFKCSLCGETIGGWLESERKD